MKRSDTKQGVIPELEAKAREYHGVMPWTEKEIQVVRAYFGRVKVRDLAEFLNRSIQSIQCKASRLGLGKLKRERVGA